MRIVPMKLISILLPTMVLISAQLLTSRGSAEQDSTLPFPEPIGTHNCLAFYPDEAERMNQEGTVAVAVKVSSLGSVTDVRVAKSSGFEMLDAAAVKCAQQWAFHPVIVNGVAMSGQSNAQIIFSQRTGHTRTWDVVPMNWVARPLWSPPPPPQAWYRDEPSENQGGIVAAYKVSTPASESDEFLSAGTYSNVPTLDDYVTRHESQLQTVADSGSFKEQRITVCHNISAWDVEYSRSGLMPRAPRQTVTINQVTVVENGVAYVASYIRPAGDPASPEAEEWIHAYCKSDSQISNPATPEPKTSRAP